MLERGNYRYELGPGLPGVPELTSLGIEIAETINEAAGRRFPVRVETIPGSPQRLQAHVTLSDQTQVTIDLRPRVMPLAAWLPYVLVAQLLLLILCTWLAVRLAIRPLLRLANAAEALDPEQEGGSAGGDRTEGSRLCRDGVQRHARPDRPLSGRARADPCRHLPRSSDTDYPHEACGPRWRRTVRRRTS